MKHYPSRRYHPDHGDKLVHSAEEDEGLVGWFESPADYGVETCPGLVPDPAIAAKREAYLKAKADAKPETPSDESPATQRKPRRAKA